jgi:nitrogen-specific signal transduction histidine kinase
MVEREELERAANRLDLVSRWADDLAHEIKNPLHAMVINLELVKRRAGSDDPGPLIERAEVVESELHRVHALVDSLLRLVRPWPIASSASVQQVFDALLPVFQARARIRHVQYEHRPGSAIVAMPPGDLAQVLVNLVDRAIDATSQGGRVLTGIDREGAHARIAVEHVGAEGAGVAGAEQGVAAGPTLPVPAQDGGRAAEEGDPGLAVTRRLLERAGGGLDLDSGSTRSRATATVPCTGSA